MNQERSAAGMGALASRSQVTVIATGHSRAMAERGEIFHNPSYFTAASRKSLGARLLGENVAMNGSADNAHRRLMASPGHRANTLNASFDAIGLAVVRDGSGTSDPELHGVHYRNLLRQPAPPLRRAPLPCAALPRCRCPQPRPWPPLAAADDRPNHTQPLHPGGIPRAH